MNEFQQLGYAGMGEQQFAPQGFLGGMFGAPLGGMIGRGIGGLLGNANLGGQIGQVAGGLGGSMLPFGADPVSAAYAQQAQQQMAQQQLQQQQLQQLQQLQQAQMCQMMGQPMGQQLAPQGWLGNVISQVGRPLGGMVGGWLGNQGAGAAIGTMAGQLGKMLPFSVDPAGLMSPQNPFLQQHQQLLQQIQQLQQQLQQQQQQYAQLAQMISQQQGQQGQVAPQGWVGNLIGAVGQPLGGAIGGMFGNSQLGSTIGGIAGQVGRMLPFGADPMAQAYAQQAQLAQQQGQFGPANSYFPTQGMQGMQGMPYAGQPTLH